MTASANAPGHSNNPIQHRTSIRKRRCHTNGLPRESFIAIYSGIVLFTRAWVTRLLCASIPSCPPSPPPHDYYYHTVVFAYVAASSFSSANATRPCSSLILSFSTSTALSRRLFPVGTNRSSSSSPCIALYNTVVHSIVFMVVEHTGVARGGGGGGGGARGYEEDFDLSRDKKMVLRTAREA